MTHASQPMKQRIVRKEVRGYGKIQRVLFGFKPTPQLQDIAEKLRARGYEVAFLPTAEHARRGAVGRTDTAIVVPLASEADGGFLTTAKIVTALPTAKVVLVSPFEDDRVRQFAEFIDANVTFESDGPELLLKTILN
jgi:hypothetical protein